MVYGADRFTRHHCKKTPKQDRLLAIKQEINNMKLATTGEKK